MTAAAAVIESPLLPHVFQCRFIALVVVSKAGLPVISWDILGGPPDWLGNKTASPMGF